MLQQSIRPERTIFHCGDTVTFRLSATGGRPGRAVLRSNIGRAAVRRQELIRFTEEQHRPDGLDWFDREMIPDGPDAFRLTLPLTEVGIFEAKCFFFPENGSALEWAEGENFRLKVESAASICANTIYCAFVRQFGPNRDLPFAPAEAPGVEELDRAGYTVIPPSGTFRGLIGELDHIFGALGCRILQLLPIHPAPTQYGRMGRFGSPFAAIDYFNVDPALAEFDRKRTPMEQFGELVDAVHGRDGRIFLDIPVNHTGWASKLQEEHPDYFVRRTDGTFESPGAWGVEWADLCKLNYRDAKVRELMAKVFLFWCGRGVDGFRCDAGYMLPEAAWDYIVARVRREYPDTVFLLEGLGGPLAVQERLLGSSGLDWGYSELFQQYTRDQIAGGFPYIDRCSRRFGSLIHFAETHDNNRLAATSQTFSRLRFLVTALLSEGGGFGFANGAEFFAAEKIDVHGSNGLNWGAEPNLVPLIRQLNTLLADHPAFLPEAEVELIQTGPGNVIAARRSAPDGARLLILLNLDCEHAAIVQWPRDAVREESGTDLLGGGPVRFQREGAVCSATLPPGAGFCIAFDDYRIPTLPPDREPPRVAAQRADAMALAAFAALAGPRREPPENAGQKMLENPAEFCRRAAELPLPPVTRWRAERDPRRRVMVPPGDLLLIECERRFRFRIVEARETVASGGGLTGPDGGRFALTTLPANPGGAARVLRLEIAMFDESGRTERASGELVLLPKASECRIRLSADARELEKRRLFAFASNDTGGLSYFRAAWGELSSKYEAVLAANANPDYPVDRHTMLTRLRMWVRVNGFSQKVDVDSLERFTADPGNRARWEFAIPVGQGCRMRFDIEFEGALSGDAVRFRIHRHRSSGPGEPEDATPATIIVRPDLEDRINHEVTKAFTGPEQRFPAAVRPLSNGFDFAPAKRNLSFRMEPGSFTSQPEWYYMVDLPAERDYGLEDKTDLFSPGYGEFLLRGGDCGVLTAIVTTSRTRDLPIRWPDPAEPAGECAPGDLYLPALRRFVTRRDRFSTVIAGYPWFLDWGRDTLIALRGLAGSEFREESAAILRQFACFERKGTIPNMIRGLDDANRDTSDAPLYLVVAVRDWIGATGDRSLLDADCGGRTLREVLRSIVDNYQAGTPNGIAMDPKSKLVFSPSHFTWMDTNFPAGTPREGYPIEIQALWYAALEFLGEEDRTLRSLADEVAAGIERLFFTHPDGRCADCLHAGAGTPAANASPDDHIRPNQLLALTLGAVRAPEKRRRILEACEELLVPGGIRSLADRPVSFQLPVRLDGRLLNDPERPYRGHYSGPENTSRKVAYHNGTVWCWPFPAYCEALYLTGGEPVRERALALLLSAAHYFESTVPGELPEVADGDAPHRAGGCFAQAWSVSEFFRVLRLLNAER